MPRPMSPTPKDREVRIWSEGIGVKSIKGEPNKSAIPAKIKLPEDTYEANKIPTIHLNYNYFDLNQAYIRFYNYLQYP